jgi:hypothetical protein
MNDRPYRQLDWGAFLYEVTMEEVRRLTRDDPHLRFRRGETYLPDDDRYGIVWMECY